MDNVDIGWHVAQGRWMVEHGAVYRYDVFNYPNLGHAVIDEYPLFQVILYFAWSLGWWGPCLLAALVYGLLFGLLIRSAKDFHLSNSASFALAIGLLLVFLQVASALRPHMVTYLGVIAVGVFLLQHRDATNWILFWPLALLQIAWVNSHSGFILEPAMVGLFGAEITTRQWLGKGRFPWTTLRTWLGALVLVLLACFVNPYGLARLYLPFYQEGLESIRAYVGEMEPLTGSAAVLYGYLALIAAGVVAFSTFLRRGGVSYSFLFMALLFYIEALSAKKYWPIFGLFIPLLVLSSGAFAASAPRKLSPWLRIAAHLLVLISLAMAVMTRMNGSSNTSLQSLWHEYDRGRSELSLEAVTWMKAHRIEGRLFHRSEDGGLLQQSGYDQGEVFADTGFGKYDPAFIHEAGLVGERPALLPRYLDAYSPAYVVCGDFCFQWPCYLRQSGWRLIFYSPNSSVWTRPETRTDLPTVQDAEVMRIFDDDITAHGRPADLLLYGRNLITLNSMGLEDFVFARLKSLPDELHHASWYWEAARILCFEKPNFSPGHRQELLREAEQLHEDALTAEFRAYGYDAESDTEDAVHILENIPSRQLGNGVAELLLKIYLDRKKPEALALARRTDCFDLRNGRHWQYLAEAEEQARHFPEAARAWKKAVFYYPDDAILMGQASAFAIRSRDDALSQAIAESSKIYGER
jgi:tetratricopeptide (TPR) repeat protein